MPLPTAVEPSFSRCMRISKIARSLCPVSNAARAASSCSTCFLLLTLSAGRIAFGATKSVSGMSEDLESEALGLTPSLYFEHDLFRKPVPTFRDHDRGRRTIRSVGNCVNGHPGH